MPATTYTLYQLQQFALDTVDGNFQLFTIPELNYAINEGIRTVNLITGAFQGTVQLISIAGQLIYPVPAPMLFPQRAQFEKQSLDPVSIDRIGLDYPSWATDTTASLGQVSRWIPLGLSLFAIHPLDSSGGGAIYLTGIVEPNLLVNPSDAIPLEDEFIDMLVDYCGARLPLKCGGNETKSAGQMLQGFYSKIKEKRYFQELKFPQFFVKRGTPAAESKGAD
jgi:hypothetical protein